MHAGERERVDSLDVHNSYLHGSTVTFGRLIKFCIGICKRRISSGELRGCFQMRSFIGVGILIGFLCLEFWELLVMPYY
ncbi:hypothetical protein Goklo_025493 [Gossypium klotzschianum]|uniref:Uncharacterized protein n=1 Tax=Gossypium klotzschianum TaxID=34286 RepID=A0A7J8W8K5_9ROSI|nr:hypothetical protein [Gossypium klotzschianum]